MSANISKATQKQSRPARTIAILAIVLIAFSVFAGLTSATKIRLGLDLRGGTSVTLTPRGTAGGKVTSAAIDQAVSIIRQRVNSLGVAES